MKNLKFLSDSELLNEVRSLAAQERETGLEVLYRLREIESRRLYAQNYSSLHEFVVHELKYSDGSAHRRIAAMRLLRELPQAEESLKSGEFTLSNASQMHDFLRAEKKQGKIYTAEEKAELFEELVGKSTREVQETLAVKSPLSVPRETIRPINGEESKLTLVIDKKLQEKLERLKGLLAHRIPGASYGELLDTLAEMALKQLDPREKPVRQSVSKSTSKGASKCENKNESINKNVDTKKSDFESVTKENINSGLKFKTNLNPSHQKTSFNSSPLNQTFRVDRTDSAQNNQAIPMGAPPAPAPERSGAPEEKSAKIIKSDRISTRSRYIPALTRRQVWIRSQGRCEHVHEEGKRCNSRYALEIDHKHPYAKNGSHELENLQLLCRVHNGAKNLKDYGFIWKTKSSIENETSQH